MRRMKNSKNIMCGLILCTFLVILVGTPLLATAAPKKIVLKAVGILPKNERTTVPFLEFIKRLNERSNGELEVKWIGSYEAIGMRDQASACQKGVVDINYTTSAFYANIVQCVKGEGLTRMPSLKGREMGMLDIMRKAHAQANLYYLARLCSADGFMALFSNKIIDNPRTGFKGLRFRSNTPMIEFYKNLGLSGVVMSMRDVYTGMERGMVDGFYYPITSFLQASLNEVTKYMIDHPFSCGHTAILVNLDKWNSLPKHLQDLMNEVGVEIEEFEDAYWNRIIAEDREMIQKKGVEFIYFKPEDAQWFERLFWDSRWEELLRECPKYGAKIKKMFYRY